MHETPKHIAILGAGPIGLEAALAAVERGYPFTLYEAADAPGGHIAEWQHVRLFTPWEMNVSERARAALQGAGLAVPEGSACPTGAELRARLLLPLAGLPAIAPNLRLGTRVLAVGRQGLLKHEEIATPERGATPFRLLVETAGEERTEAATVVLDCTGSYAVPNRLGDGGIPAPGELQHGARISHRIPDLDGEREAWAGTTVLLVGAGHSAQTAARDFASRAAELGSARMIWALRNGVEDLTLPDDPLAERSALARAASDLLAGGSPAVEARPGRVVEALAEAASRLAVTLRAADGGQETVLVDRVLALTGSVGDHQLYRQLQVHECYASAAPMKLAAALLGAEAGDCLAQTSHGAETLRNPEPGFFILGSKSYGRNNTFLLRVGWQQVQEVFSLL